MSYILDALKKSEAERAAQAAVRPVPEIAAAQSLPATPAHRWLLPGLLVIVILLLALLAWLLRPVPVDNQVAEPASEAAPQLALVSEQVRPAPAVEMHETVLPALNPPAAALAVKPQSPEGSAPLASLRRIPDLDISGHLFSSVAEKRSVTMNGRDWREGDQIAEGIVLSEITQDGIRLTVDGWPVIVGRSRGWKAIR